MTEAAEARDTSCSPERPPKITPTRKRGMTRILAVRSGGSVMPSAVWIRRSTPQGRGWGRGRPVGLDEAVGDQPMIVARRAEHADPLARTQRPPRRFGQRRETHGPGPPGPPR